MGIISVVIEDERGETVESIRDPEGIIEQLLVRSVSWNDSTFQCLRFINLAGDTVFNNLQLPVFLDEWERISQKARTKNERKYAESIASMAQRCLETFYYLKFYGD